MLQEMFICNCDAAAVGDFSVDSMKHYGTFLQIQRHGLN